MPLFADVCFLAPSLARSFSSRARNLNEMLKRGKYQCVVDRRNRRPLGEIYFYYRPSNIYVKFDVLRSMSAGKPVSTGHNCGIKLDALLALRLTLNIVISTPEFVWVCLNWPEVDEYDTARDARSNSSLGRRHTFPLLREPCGILRSEFIVVHAPGEVAMRWSW